MKAGCIHHKPRRLSFRRRGFSLIELLAALTLAGLLMLTTGQLLKILRQQEALITRTAQSDSAWISRTLDLLEQDLQNSRKVRATKNGFELSGFAGTQNSTGQPNQKEVQVSWTVENQLDQYWLIRTELNPSALSNRPNKHTIIATDVYDVSLWFTDAPDVSFFTDGSYGEQWSPLPSSITCQLLLQTQTSRRRTVLLKP